MSDSRTVRMPMARIEGRNLDSLVSQLQALLGDPEEPGVPRLVPEAYPDDPEASADFAAATRSDLLDRRAADAARVRRALRTFAEPGMDLEELDAEIAVHDLDAWLRTLTALRLVIATRLGIETEDEERDPADTRFAVYDWLGYRLELLVEAADAEDDTLL